MSLDDIVREVQCRLVERALGESGGVKAQAASLLGLKYSTFWELLQRLGHDTDKIHEAGSEDAGSLTDAHSIVVRLSGFGESELSVAVDVAACDSLLREVTQAVKLAVARNVVERADGNIARAAELARTKYTTFHSFLRRLPVAEISGSDTV